MAHGRKSFLEAHKDTYNQAFAFQLCHLLLILQETKFEVTQVLIRLCYIQKILTMLLSH